MNLFIETLGWLAALLILFGYAGITTGRLTPTSVTYQLLNIGGAIGFIINSGWNGAIPSAALNVVWLGFGVFGLGRLLRTRRARDAG